MSELVIQGLSFEQYAQYTGEATPIRQKWELSEGTADIKDEVLQVLAKYNIDPQTLMDEDGLNYHTFGMIPEWLDVINKDPELLVKYSQISSAAIQQAMFGDAGDSADMDIEGINLEKYAETAAKLQHAEEADMPAIVAGLGYADMDHYKRVSDGFSAAMEQDTSAKLATHFGQLFAQYGTGHMEATQQHSVDLVAEALEENDDREQREEQAVAEIMKRAAAGDVDSIIGYLKEKMPEDADDDDSLDWFLDKACDLFGEAGNRDAAKALLEVRFTLQEDEEDKDEWVNDAMEMLFV